MKLAIIVPIYNVEKYISTCLDSLKNQKDEDVEFLLIDDGSKDDSTEIAKEYAKKDPRFKYYHKENGGLSDARNYGVKKTDAEYIFFVDSDDYIEKDAIKKIKEKLVDNPDCVVFDVRYFWDNKDESKIVNGVYDYSSDLKKNLLMAPPSAWNKVFKKELHEKYKEPVGRYYEDMATTPKILLECEKIEYINEYLYNYRQRQGSIIYSLNERSFDIFKDFEEIIDFYKEKNMFEEYKDEYEYMMIEHILLNANRRFIKSDKPKEYLNRSYEFVHKYFTKPLKNKYYKKLSLNDRLFVHLAYHRHVKLLKLLIKIKNIKK